MRLSAAGAVAFTSRSRRPPRSASAAAAAATARTAASTSHVRISKDDTPLARPKFYAVSRTTSSGKRGSSNSSLKAETTSGSNCVPAQRSSSEMARSCESLER